MFEHLLAGFVAVLSVQNLLFSFVGCVLGMLVGVLPGFGPAAATALLLPITMTIGPIPAIIMMSAILYGSQYGGTITAVLINVPGEMSSVVTLLDGYPMARAGRSGPALAIAAIGSFVGGMVGFLGFLVAAPLSSLALAFGPAEFFTLTLLGLTLVVGLAQGSMVKALIAGAIGLLASVVGPDPAYGILRLTFGLDNLFGGLDIVAVVVGLFGLSEMFASVERRNELTRKPIRVTSVMPTADDLRVSAMPIVRGSLIGFFSGLLPGVPSAASSFAAYIAERRLSKRPETFGTGNIVGVAAPETANNAHMVAGMIPMFTLGIPTSAVTAVMMTAFIINGLAPGPLLFKNSPDIAWAIIASLVTGNVILLILNLPLIGIWTRLLRTPYPILYCVVVIFMVVGTYTIDNDAFNVRVALLAGLLGYGLKKLDIPLAPVALTLVLGRIMEGSLTTALQISGGSLSAFYRSPIAMTLLTATTLILVLAGTKGRFRRRVRSNAALAGLQDG